MIKFKRLVKSFHYAMRGLIKTIREEQNLKVQGIVAIIVTILAYFLNITRIEWCLLIFAIVLVVVMEIINSAVERVTDVLKPRIHDYVKEIKDIMAAAVMLASVAASIIGLIIFLPYLIS